MITLEKSLALVAMQATLQSKNLQSVFSCVYGATKISSDDEKLVALFSDSSLLLVTVLDDSDESQHELNFEIFDEPLFCGFVTKVVDSYKSFDLCVQWETLVELWEIVEHFDSNKELLFNVVLSDYTYSYSIDTLVNYVENNACIFEGSRSDYAYELIEDCYDMKSMGTLANYIDYDAFGRDMELSSEIQKLDYNVYWTNPNDIY